MKQLLPILSAVIGLPLLLAALPALATHRPLAQLEAAKRSKDPGAVVYQSTCSQCHAVDASIPVGAPKFKQLGDWQPRMKKGMKAMMTNLYQGLNIMPPRGGCFECTDKLLEQATIYMLPDKLKPNAHKTSEG